MAAKNRIGTQIGPYEILAEVGRGGVSRVYRAYDHSKDREVAVKIMTAEAAEDEDFVRRFQREIDIASSLDHPNILPVLDWGRDEDLYFLVMPLVKNGTLNDILRQGRVLTPYQAWRAAFQIADALDYAHQHGIVHRDVKPHNIVALDEATFALTDFGLVKLMDSKTDITNSGCVLGSPSYMSPEQARCRNLDQRTDVYSLGIVLYECLVGRLPYNAPTAMEMITQHVLARPLYPSEIAPGFPVEIEAVLMRALCKDPAARYYSAGDLARSLGTALTCLSDEVQNRPLVSADQVISSTILQNDPVTLILPPEPQKTRWAQIAVVAGIAAGLVVGVLLFLNLILHPQAADTAPKVDDYSVGTSLISVGGMSALEHEQSLNAALAGLDSQQAGAESAERADYEALQANRADKDQSRTNQGLLPAPSSKQMTSYFPAGNR